MEMGEVPLGSLKAIGMSYSNHSKRDVERSGDVIGIGSWLIWVLATCVALSLVNGGQWTKQLLSSPVFDWLRFGPMLTFLFVGRYLRARRHALEARHVYRDIALISLVPYLVWMLLLALSGLLQVDVPFHVTIIVGLAIYTIGTWALTPLDGGMHFAPAVSRYVKD